ncbi:MAG: hypothetical protein M1824_003951 [Vezdaea acicularis]|nr:MAG: hypothetical protein M1824_003951 [Vezdaea acicularis]
MMSGMSSLWSSFGLGSSSSTAKTEKAKAAIEADLKYLYSAFTKVPCLKLAPDRKARLIEGYEEFPFDSAVPLLVFKNISTLEICDIDIRQFFGWDTVAEQLRSLSVKRASVDDPAELLIDIVLDDMDKRRRRSSKTQASPVLNWAAPSPTLHHVDIAGGRSNSAPGSPKPENKTSQSVSPKPSAMVREGSGGSKTDHRPRPRSISPSRPRSLREGSAHRRSKSGVRRHRRAGSNSSQSSANSLSVPNSSSSNQLMTGQLPATKWRFLRHLSLADNSLTTISPAGLAPLAFTLHSLDLSSNLFTQIPDALASLTSLRALNLSSCMIESLHSLLRSPIPAITALNLRNNRLHSIAGVERLPSLERLDLRENRLSDPIELARLTGSPEMREVWVAGNPFTKTHTIYRITIFNLFRKAPGYTEDIIIDSTGPGYSERRQLVDRVGEAASVPVVQAPVIEHPPPPPKPAETHEARPTSNGQLYKASSERPIPRHTQSDTVASSPRRRKGPKRRIVELSHGDSPMSSPPPFRPSATSTAQDAANAAAASAAAAMYQTASPAPVSTSSPASPSASTATATTTTRPMPFFAPPERKNSREQPPRLNTSMPPPSIHATHATPTTATPAGITSNDWNISGEIYKRKIEALRNEVGNGWLSVLSEENAAAGALGGGVGWTADPNKLRGQSPASPGDFSPASTIRPSPTTPRAGPAQGRTLG